MGGVLTQDLRTMRVLYFIFFAMQGLFFTFVNIYYQELGLPGTQIGLLSTLTPLVGIAGMTLWGVLHDRFGHTSLLLRSAAIGAGLSALAFLPMRSFASLAPVVVCYSLFASALIPLLDSTTLSLLEGHGEDYGKHRIWGSIGFMVSSTASGLVLQWLGLRAMFPVIAGLLGGIAIVAGWLPRRHVEMGGFSLRGLNVMLRQPAWVIFAASVFLMNMAAMGMFTLLGPIVKLMGGTASLYGLSWTLAGVSELPVMLGSAWLLRRWGAGRLVALSYTFYSARAFLYSIMPSPGWILPIHAVFGSAFGLYWIGFVSYSAQLAPARLKTTGQSVLMSVASLANVIGGVSSGWIFDQVGAVGLYQVLTLVSGCALAIQATGWLATRRKRSTEP